MMYYIDKANRIWMETEKGFMQIGIEAKDKVTVIKELESVTVVPSKKIVKTIDVAQTATLDTIVKKFHVSEENPIVIDVKKASK